MTRSMSDTIGRKQVHGNTVQGYIDETPVWADGTVAPATPMTDMQQRIWWLAVAGKFFEGMVVFMTGVALPLIVKEFGLSAVQHGIVGAATLFGILVGASALGGLSDRLGRKPIFVFEMGLFTVFLVLVVVAVVLPPLGMLIGAFNMDKPTRRKQSQLLLGIGLVVIVLLILARS